MKSFTLLLHREAQALEDAGAQRFVETVLCCNAQVLFASFSARFLCAYGRQLSRVCELQAISASVRKRWRVDATGRRGCSAVAVQNEALTRRKLPFVVVTCRARVKISVESGYCAGRFKGNAASHFVVSPVDQRTDNVVLLTADFSLFQCYMALP